MMAFDTAYPNRKDWRRPYRGSKAVDGSCRNHGTCPYCRGNRLHGARKREDESRSPETFWTLSEIEPSPDWHNRTAERVLLSL